MGYLIKLDCQVIALQHGVHWIAEGFLQRNGEPSIYQGN